MLYLLMLQADIRLNDTNLFLKHKYISFIFILTFIVFIICYYKNSVGLFFDIPAMFLACITPFDGDKTGFIMYHPNRTRIFNDFLVAIPFNAVFVFIKNLPVINALRMYSSSYFIVHFLALFINFLVARRTKRYDIAVTAFVFYSFFCIPNAIWAVREVHITVLLQFALLSYYLSNEKLLFRDLIPVLLLIVYMFESFEITIVYGILLFIFSFLYTKKERDEKNPWYKILIGFSCALIALYMPLKMIYLYFKGGLSFSQGANEWAVASLITLEHIFDGNGIIVLFSLFAFIFVIFYKKAFSGKSLLFIVPYILGLLVVLYYKTGFMPEPHIEIQNYSYVFWFVFPVYAVILLTDYFNINISKYNKCFYSNLYIVGCIAGILNILWQINSCFEFGKYEVYLKNLMKNSKEIVVTIPEEDFNKYRFLKYNTCFGTLHKSAFLADDYVVEKIIVPSDKFPDYSLYCFDDKDNNFYDSETGILHLQTAPLRLKNRYWDLSVVKNGLENAGKIQKSE